MNLPLLLLLLGVSQKQNQQWENFKLTYNKNYDSVQEEVQRKAIFLENVKEIEDHKGVNEYSDMAENEFKEKILRTKFEEDPMLILHQEALKTELDRQWKEFKMTHEKEYESDDEEMVRKEIFNENVKMINEHNRRHNQELETFSMGINQFTDLTNEEFESMFATGDFSDDDSSDIDEENPSEASKDEPEQASLSKSVNWYTNLIPVKEQGNCGSCWAFSATGVLEYANYLKTHQIVSLSEQELIDCDSVNFGCNGGNTYLSLNWVHQNKINFETDYPYAQRQDQCHRRQRSFGGLIKTVGRAEKSEADKVKIMQSYGPIQVSVCTSKKWQHFKTGYVTNCDCTGVTHSVVAVGAIKENGRDLWLLRNSWGKDWGIQGHIKLLMFQNMCSIAQRPGAYITH